MSLENEFLKLATISLEVAGFLLEKKQIIDDLQLQLAAAQELLDRIQADLLAKHPA